MENRKSAVVALGMFDGMHIGHRELIARCVQLARARGAVPAVYTFSNHPQAVLTGESPRILMDAEERAAIMHALGAEDVRMVPFTKTLAALTPEAFIGELCAQWTLSGVVVGYNYSFGQYGAGDPDRLRLLGDMLGFTVEVVPQVDQNGGAVSSTRIRALIEAGEVEAAAAMLVSPYTLSGTVIKNRQIGRTIHFPTANIVPEPGRVLPLDGVYAARARIEDGMYRAVTNVGTNPTVGGECLSVETHLIGFEGDLYGKPLAVSFLSRLRGEMKFSSVEELKNQIARDVETVKNR